jgi:Kef-type K+ transport system membrane component KefB
MSSLVLYLGIIIIAAIFTKILLVKLEMPSLIGFIGIGILLQAADPYIGLLDEGNMGIIDFLAELGIVILLFHIGLESKLNKLLQKIGQATLIGIGGIVISGALGFAAAYYLLELSIVPSLIIAAAMVATSIGVSAGIWEENKVINSDQGQLLLDTAEFDDVIGVIIMALIFSTAPLIAEHKGSSDIFSEVVKSFSLFMLKLFIFGLGCVMFAKYLEKPVTKFFRNLEKPPEASLMVIALGIIIAALADILGFSPAIGAFFAGLIFSRDPASIKSTTVVQVLYDLFVPFFFISIGLKMKLETIPSAAMAAAVLSATAFAGKFAGTFSPSLFFCNTRDSALIGLSMIPRAEVTMIIMQRSLEQESSSMPRHIYSAMVITSIITCIIPPLLLHKMIKKSDIPKNY